jgi:hypothetical protein
VDYLDVMVLRIRIRLTARDVVFQHPIDPIPRTAILTPGFRESRSIRVFPNGWNDEVARFAPSAIAVPSRELRLLMDAPIQLGHALIALTHEGGRGLSFEDRDQLWQAFGVPVFEQYLTVRNKLLAAECEAHAGLHVVSGCWGFKLEESPCACGNPAPRLLRTVPVPARAQRTAVA